MKEHQWKNIWYDTAVNIKYKCIQQKETNGNKNQTAADLRGCVKVEVDVLGTPSLIVLTVSVDVKNTLDLNQGAKGSGAVWKSRWPSSAPRP